MVVLLFILGLIIGSFIANYTYRLPKNISISKGRSKCDNCKEEIVWYDNIPVISFLLLHGKCRFCRGKISIRYPLIEFFTAIGFVLTLIVIQNNTLQGYSLQGTVVLPFYLFIFALLLAIIVIDLEHQIIPDELNFALFITVFVMLLLFVPEKFYINMLVGLSASLFLLIVNLITFGRGMGLGDVKFALGAGMLIGWPQAILWMFSSFVIGAVVGIILIIFGKAKFGKHIAFGPFLVIGLVFAMIIPTTYAVLF